MKNKFYILATLLLMLFTSIQGYSQNGNSLLQPFSDLNGWYVDDKGAVDPISAGSHSIVNGHLQVKMGSQSNPISDPVKYRGDLKWTTTNADDYYTVRPATETLLAIKFIGDKPDATLKLELHDVNANTYIGKYSPKGSIQTTGNNNIYYFLLTDKSEYTGDSILLDKVYFTIADNVVDTSYVVDWIATYADLDALVADKDVKDDGEGDVDEGGSGEEIVHGVDQPFAALNGWYVDNKPAVGDISAGSYEVAEGHLNVKMGSQSDPVSDPVKYRGDLKWVTTNASEYYTFQPGSDSLLAIKFIGDKPDATLKLELHDAVNSTYIGKYSPKGSIITTNNNSIYYFQLTDNESYTGESLSIDKIYFTVADNTVDTAYVVDWIATYPNLDELEANKDINDDGEGDTDEIGVVKSDNAFLSNILSDVGEFTSVFDSTKVEYTLNIPALTTTVNLTGVASNEGATVEGDGAINVSSGDTTVTILVTSENEEVHMTYTVAIKVLSNDATLSTLVPTVGVLAPAFDPEVMTYDLEVPSGVSVVSFSATSTHPNAIVTGTSNEVSLATGSGTKEIVVTSQDGTVTNTYTINITVEGTGVSDNSMSSLRLFPNPVANNLTISGVKRGAIITILSATGVVLDNINVDNTTTSLNVETLKKGVYMLKVEVDSDVTIKRFVKK